jgi:hypothetical protein
MSKYNFKAVNSADVLGIITLRCRSPIQSYHVLELVIVPNKLLLESAWHASTDK